ncbi:hypothetical protein AYR66_21865 [Noviherbaspirillum denitrificans]|uniref:Uncharacterized protein n=1 Tax=Noviherbaspirillum denitrificans TaxID=1968433 RepID=A0A254TGF8_9BURK|nr:hypothetical protein AYR66_21865 [Noviherbaspirillum denitrificans]
MLPELSRSSMMLGRMVVVVALARGTSARSVVAAADGSEAAARSSPTDISVVANSLFEMGVGFITILLLGHPGHYQDA